MIRKRNGETGALALAAVAVDGAFVLAHDAVGDGQAQTGALPERLRRKERIVDSREVFVGNAGPRIRDFGGQAAVVEARGDGEPAAFGHRITCVEEQIQEHLLQLVLHSEHHQRLVTELASHFDVRHLELVLEE